MAVIVPILVLFVVYAGAIFLLGYAIERASKRLERPRESPKVPFRRDGGLTLKYSAQRDEADPAQGQDLI